MKPPYLSFFLQEFHQEREILQNQFHEPEGEQMFIAISGAIGAGKSTVTRVLSQIWEFDALYETVEGHPWLEKFYKNPKEYSFKTQIFFLYDRFNKHFETARSGRDIVADRSLYEDGIFAKVLHMRGEMDDDEYLKTYYPHFDLLTRILQPPDIMIYLRASLDTLLYRIRRRARDMEKDIDVGYLQMLNDAYEEWIEEEYPYQKLIIDTDDLDLTCDLHNDTLYLTKAIIMKITQKKLPDEAKGINRLIAQLPLVHPMRDSESMRSEIFK